MADLIGQMVGQYRITGVLGTGGMGRVYLGEHIVLGRRAAIKVLRVELAGDDTFVRRFLREARIAGQLRHPNIAEVYEAATDNAVSYIAMRFIEGRSLRAILDDGPVSVADTIRYVQHIAAALDHAHAEGYVHRDIKPGNIIIDTHGDAVLVDFGIAAVMEDLGLATSSMTVPGSIVGTPAYLSPEQALGHPITPRTDIYALGCVTYELLTGAPPFAGRIAHAVVTAHMSERPPEAQLVAPHLNQQIGAVVARALEKSPEARFPSAGLFAAALSNAAGGGAATVPGARGTGQARESEPQPLQSARGRPDLGNGSGSRRSRLIGAGVLALVLLLAPLLFRLVVGDDGDRKGSITTPSRTSSASDASTVTVSPTSVTTTNSPSTVPSPSPSAATAPAGVAIPTPTEALVVYESVQDGISEVVVANVNGTDPVSLTDRVSAASAPVWSPDGLRVAYVQTTETGSDIWVVDWTGENRQQLTADAAVNAFPAWSPDGSMIAWSRAADGLRDVYVMSADGSDQRRAGASIAAGERPRFSPDGSWILFVSDRDGSGDLYAVSPDGNFERWLTTGANNDHDPEWSPDGERIVFVSDQSGDEDIWSIGADGNDPRNLTAHPSSDRDPSWSPDGKWVAFVTERDARQMVYVMDADGSEPHAVSNVPGNSFEPAWSAAGPWIVFTADHLGTLDLFVTTHQAGSIPYRITGDPADERRARWTPRP